MAVAKWPPDMNTLEMEAENSFALASETVIHLPAGLLGFESIKRYLLTRTEDGPFYWLQAENDSSLSFLVISPFDVEPDYAPDIPNEDVRSLGIECPDDVLLFNIVTLRPNGVSTVNLKGPIVINRFSRIGKQVIIGNSSEYSVQHPLPSPTEE
jgi:flagellar assembly factor FliW